MDDFLKSMLFRAATEKSPKPSDVERAQKAARRDRRAAWIGDHPILSGAVGVLVVGVSFGWPAWLLVLVIIGALVVGFAPPTRRRLRQRMIRRRDTRAWYGDVLTVGVAQALGLCAPGGGVQVLRRYSFGAEGTRVLDFSLVPGVTYADVEGRTEELREAFGAAHALVERVGPAGARVTLYDGNPLDAVSPVSWASGDGSDGDTTDDDGIDLGGRPWWEDDDDVA